MLKKECDKMAMRKEFEGKALKKEASNRTLGAVFLLVTVLVIVIGTMVHFAQIGGLPADQTMTVLVAQLNMKFLTDVLVGFFTGMFLLLGIYYLRLKKDVATQTVSSP